MKKLLFLSVGVFLSLFLAGCGDDEKSNSNPQDIGEIMSMEPVPSMLQTK